MSLKIYLLGQFSLRAGERPLSLPSRPAQSLFAYLALNAGVTHRRERLAGLLWPDATEGNARAYLRQAIWRIRKALDGETLHYADYLQTDDVSVTFVAGADYWLDVAEVLRPSRHGAVEELQETVGLYRGELLPGFYDEWIPAERDRVQAAYQEKMHLLLRGLLRSSRWQEALQWSERWLQMTDGSERAFRALMRAYAGLGDQAMVKTTYDRCGDTLAEMLGLEPSQETVRLYDALRQGGEVDLPVEADRVAVMKIPAFMREGAATIERPVFVGRGTQQKKLRRFLSQALQGQGRVVFVSGEAGSGKTALMHEFAHRALMDQTELLVASGSCNMHTGMGDPYLPFREIMEMLTGDVEGRWAAGAIDSNHARALWRSLSTPAQAMVRHGPGLINTFVHGPALVERVLASQAVAEAWLARLQELANVHWEARSGSGKQQSDLFEQYTRTLQTIARQQPLALLIDDLQWADQASISLLFHLGRNLAGSHILIVGAYRPEDVALGRDGQRHPLEAVINELQREFGDNSINLRDAQGREFVNDILDSEANELGPSFRHLMFQQTQGNPLFTVELLRGMQERGDLRQNAAGAWVEGTALNWENLPARVEAVIAERIGRLAPALQEIVRTASVEGEVFTAEIVARVLGKAPLEIVTFLNDELERKHRLVKAESIVRHGDDLFSRYRFRHNLFQRYLYNGLSTVKRVHLHEQVGRALEQIYGASDELTAVAPQLARHFAEAQIPRKAIDYLHQAAQKALALSGYQEAVAHVQKALALLHSLPPSSARDQQELGLQITLAAASQSLEGSQSAAMHAAWARARELSDRTGERLQYSFVLGEMAVHYFVQAQYREALALGEQALQLARETGDPLRVAMGHWYLGFSLFATGNYAGAHDHFARTIAYYDPQVHHQQLVSLRGSDLGLSALGFDACCLWCLGQVQQAQRSSERALALARAFGHPFTLADVLFYAGCMYHKLCRNVQTQLDCSIEFCRLLEEFRPGVWLGEAYSFRGDALVHLGRIEEGLDLLEQGVGFNRSVNILLFSSVYLCSLAEAQVRMGLVQESWSTLQKAQVFAARHGEWLWAVEMLRLEAKLLQEEGRQAEAMQKLQEAVQAARDQATKSLELRASLDLAELLEAQGDREAARDLLIPLVQALGEGGDTADLRAARSRLRRSGWTMRG